MNMQIMNQITTEQLEMIRRLCNHTGKKVKIKLYDGTSIVGRLIELQWTKFVQQVNNVKGLNEFDNLPEACYLRAEHGTLAIPYKDIAGFELSF
jgi:hypothetical protein